jgi:Zn-dependent peptidase ImmA (M78 family)
VSVRTKRAAEKAEKLVAELQIRSIPVDVNQVAEALGLMILYQSLGDDVSGLLVTQGDTATICVQESHPAVRQRFTIAHEIAHFYLKHQFEPGEQVHVDEGWKISARGPLTALGLDRQEIEANQFAASLLMPETLVRERLKQIGRPSDVAVSELARQFKVSEQAMTIRLTTLHL